MECQCLQTEFGDLAGFGIPFGPVHHPPDAPLPPTNMVPSSRSASRWYKNSVWSVQFGYNSHHRETIYRHPGLLDFERHCSKQLQSLPGSMLNSHKRKAKWTGRSNQKLQPGRNHIFLLRIGLGRSKGLILNHIFGGITALILTSAVAHAGDGEDLLKAAFAGDLVQVRTLLEKGADIDHQNRAGATALYGASQNGHERIVQALLAEGAEIDHQTKNGATALLIASQNGHEEIVQALLARARRPTTSETMVGQL